MPARFQRQQLSLGASAAGETRQRLAKLSSFLPAAAAFDGGLKAILRLLE